MISVRLNGGMGNQMFQYAAARALSLRKGDNLCINPTAIKGDWQRCYSLGLWNIAALVREENFPVRREKDYTKYDSIIFDGIRGDVALDGYWQCEKYFEDAEAVLRKDFTPRQGVTDRAKRYADLIQSAGTQSVILTFRRGDKGRAGDVPGMDYYEAAIRKLIQKVPDPYFFIDSDDPEWVKENFKTEYRIIHIGDFDRSNRNHLGREDEQLWLHSQCYHSIQTNSTFSWWGTWLNPERDRIVICPKVYSPAHLEECWGDIYPERWTRI